jgi:hypothetical protein
MSGVRLRSHTVIHHLDREMSMTRARFTLPAITIGAAASLLCLAAPAQAAAAVVPAGGVNPLTGAGPAIVNSTFFAGYEATVAAGSATTSTARFRVPKLTCTSATRAITAVAGVEVKDYVTFSSAALAVECFSNAAVYFPELTVNGTQYNYQTSPAYAGNVIELSAKVTTAGTTVTVKDVTRGVTKTKTGAGASANAPYVGDSGSASLAVPAFGTITFRDCKVDGATLKSKRPTEYQRQSSSGVLQISTGSLSATGTKFATHFKHS